MSKLANSWHSFLKTNFNSIMRSSPNIYKERKYEHVDIRLRFEQVEKERKKQRLALIEYKKSLKLKIVQKQLDFLQKYNLDEIPNLSTKQELQKLSKQKHLQNSGSYEEHMKKVLKDDDATQFLELEKTLHNEESKKSMMHKLESQVTNLQKEIHEIHEMKNELDIIRDRMEEMEPTHVLVEGLQKKIVLNMVMYYEFQARNLQGVLINPETIKAIETVHYHVEHNLPIRRELLYEVVPEIFENEIELLPPEEQKRILAKRPRLENQANSLIHVVEKEDFELKDGKPHFYEELRKQEFDMRNFVYKKCIEFADKFDEHIDQKLSEGFYNVQKVLENIENKEKSKLSDIELQMYEGLMELKKINSDYAELVKMNKVRVFNKQREMIIPEFVKNNKQLLDSWTEKWEQLVSNSFEFSDSLLVPKNVETHESKLDQILKQQKADDLQSLIQQSQLEYKARVSGEEPIPAMDRVNKNENLMKKLNILTGAMSQIDDHHPERKKLPTTRLNTINPEAPEERRILVDEIPKVLFLNNRDPKKYDLKFWATHFNIEPAKLRNIFNFVSFAIPDITNEKETGRVFRFIVDGSEI